MAIWPFRRKSGRKRSRSGTTSDVEGPPPRSQTDGAITRAASKKKQRTDPTKLQRRTRAYSFSPGRHDSIRVDRPEGSRPTQSQGRNDVNRGDAGNPPWDRTPTLYHKRSNHNPPRRKSSKRKRQDQNREAELKAATKYAPTRPATDSWSAGRPVRKDTKRAKTTDLGRQWDRPTSDLSLPMSASIHSSLSTDSDFGAYKVSAFSSLAPRPTLRYEPGSRWTPSTASAPTRSGSHRRHIADREPIPEETLRAHKRIDDLVDDLDASDLRELMERDQRRRDRKQLRDQDRMGRRLARRAEKHKSDDDTYNTDRTPQENLDRGVMGRELVGLGIEPPSAVVTSSRHRAKVASEEGLDSDEAHEKPPLKTFHRTDTAPKDDLGDERPAATFEKVEVPKKQPSRAHEPEEPVSALPQGSLLAGLLRSKKTRSKSTLNSDRDRTDTPPSGRIEEEPQRKDSEASTKTNRFSLSSFIKRGGRNRRDSGPSSFSNTSREEMQAAGIAHAQALQAQAYAQAYAQSQSQTAAQAAGTIGTEAPLESHAASEHTRKPSQSNPQALAKLQGEDALISDQLAKGNYVSRQPSSAAPKRTRSRFREDLPEFPLSPPDSRVQSPEAEPPLPTLTEQVPMEDVQEPKPERRRERNVHGHYSSEQPRPIPTSNDRSFGIPSPEPTHSMSLASIDSEGSWLSGKVGSRRTSALRDSLARVGRRGHARSSGSPSNSTQEDLAIADDDYLSKLAPERNSGMNHLGGRSEDARPSSDEEDDGHSRHLKWGAVGANKPTIIHTHGRDRRTMQSQEGLLDMDTGEDDEVESNSPTSPYIAEQADLRRARSVNLGKGHVRNFSAGSAKLLDITPRGSVDQKSRSQERRRSVPLDL